MMSASDLGMNVRGHEARNDLLLLFLLASVCAWAGWGTWPDALADWGAHLYTAWRVSVGSVLYRDIAFFEGPTSIYFSALLFKIFGVNQRVLWIANLVILGGIIAMLYSLIRSMSGRFTAMVCCVAFVIVFPFGQYV